MPCEGNLKDPGLYQDAEPHLICENHSKGNNKA